jgi:hypothetical protein
VIAATVTPPAPDVLGATTLVPLLADLTSRQDNPQNLAISDPTVSPAAQDLIESSRLQIRIVIPRP